MTDLVAAAQQGRVVIDTGAPPLDGDRYTITGVGRAPAAPKLDVVYPTTFEIGSPSRELVCLGDGFGPDSRIVFAGNVERTTFVSEHELRTGINSEVWTNPDPAVPVLVRTVNGDTATLTVAIVAAAP